MPTTEEILSGAINNLHTLKGHIFDFVQLKTPDSANLEASFSLIISKLSPLLGNVIEFKCCEELNKKEIKEADGKWVRRDPGFPDVVFQSSIEPLPGIEIKAWFPLSTEITARFKESQADLQNDNINVAIVAWIPEFIVYGSPYILDIATFSALSIAKARDSHYHNPPNYLVLEPEETSHRAQNTQQFTTTGYVLQMTSSPECLAYTKELLEEKEYSCSSDYQKLVRQLRDKIRTECSIEYRLDTNYAKMDRIGHRGINDFKEKILNTIYKGKKIKEWAKIVSKIAKSGGSVQENDESSSNFSFARYFENYSNDNSD